MTNTFATETLNVRRPCAARMLAATTAVCFIAGWLMGCGSSNAGQSGGGEAASFSHWFEQNYLLALRGELGRETGPDPQALAEIFAYEIARTGDEFATAERDIDGVKSRIGAQVVHLRGRADTTRITLAAEAGEIAALTAFSDAVADTLRGEFGRPTSTAKPTATPDDVMAPEKVKESWLVDEVWVITFDPAVFRPAFVLEIFHDPAKRKSSSPDASVNRPGTGTDDGATAGTNSGNSNGTDAGPTMTDPPPVTGADEFSNRPPASLTDDRRAFDGMHQKFLAACNGETDVANLRSRKILRNGREWLIEKASTEGLHCVGGGGMVATFTWDRLQPETLLTGYRDLANRTLADEFGIVMFCYERGLLGKGDDILKRLLDRADDADNFKRAIDAFVARRRGISVPAGGFVVYKFSGAQWRFITPEERQDIQNAERIANLLQQIERNADSRRASDWQDLDRAIGQLAREDAGSRRVALDVLREQREKALQKIESLGVTSSLRRTLYNQLQTARQDALQTIYDTEVYPDENHGAVGQPTVDEKVKIVRELWDDPYAAIERNTPTLAEQKQRIADFTRLMKTLDPSGELMPITPAEPLLADVRQAVNAQVNLREMSNERQLRELFTEIERDNREGQSDATAREIEFATILNNYRWMLGREPLRINSHLTLAARAHGDYMKATSQFAHEIPGHPEGATPRDRARKFGYGGSGIGENITMASGGHSPQSAFDSWYNSSGHHRNMLRDSFRVIGVGDSGSHWVNKFGISTDGSEPRAGR